MTTTHAQTPYRVTPDTDSKGNRGYRIDGPTVSLVAWVFEGENAADAKATADFIVRACNAHYAALDTLAAAVARVEIANAEGSPILSAWLPDARATLAAMSGDAPAAADREALVSEIAKMLANWRGHKAFSRGGDWHDFEGWLRELPYADLVDLYLGILCIDIEMEDPDGYYVDAAAFRRSTLEEEWDEELEQAARQLEAERPDLYADAA